MVVVDVAGTDWIAIITTVSGGVVNPGSTRRCGPASTRNACSTPPSTVMLAALALNANRSRMPGRSASVEQTPTNRA